MNKVEIQVLRMYSYLFGDIPVPTLSLKALEKIRLDSRDQKKKAQCKRLSVYSHRLQLGGKLSAEELEDCDLLLTDLDESSCNPFDDFPTDMV